MQRLQQHAQNLVSAESQGVPIDWRTGYLQLLKIAEGRIAEMSEEAKRQIEDLNGQIANLSSSPSRNRRAKK